MNNERYNQIIDEVYENYLTQARIEFEKWRQENPYTLVDFREDTKELFLKSIKEDIHWFTGEKNYSQKWGLKIEERELSLEERSHYANSNHYEVSLNIKMFTGIDADQTLHEQLDMINIPTKLITITYKDEKIEIYE